MMYAAPKPPVIATSYPDLLGVDPIGFDFNSRDLWISRLALTGLIGLFYLDPASRHTMLQPRVVSAFVPVLFAMYLTRNKVPPLIADRDGIVVGNPRAVERIYWRNIGQIWLGRTFFHVPVVNIRLRSPVGRPFDPSHDQGRFDFQFGLFGPGPRSAFLEFLERARSLAAPEAARVCPTALPRTNDITLTYPRRRMTGWGLAALVATAFVLVPWSHTSWVARPLLALLCLWADYKFLCRLIRPIALHLGPDGFRSDYAPQLGIVEWRDTKSFTLRARHRLPPIIGLHFAPGSLRRAVPFAKKYPEDFMLPHFGTGSRAEFVNWPNAYRCKALAESEDRKAPALHRNVA